MKTNNNIQGKIDSTFSAMDAIEDVKISPFFKDKTMRKLFAEKEETQIAWNWFTPKLQLATLVCVIVLNVLAFTQINSNTYDNNISEFADNYGLVIDAKETLFDIN